MYMIQQNYVYLVHDATTKILLLLRNFGRKVTQLPTKNLLKPIHRQQNVVYLEALVGSGIMYISFLATTRYE